MIDEIKILTLAGLLHDIGKISVRAGTNNDHSRLVQEYLSEDLKNKLALFIEQHHKKEAQSKIENNQYIKILYLANQIALSNSKDDMFSEGTGKCTTLFKPLSSIFNILHQPYKQYVNQLCNHDEGLTFPTDDKKYRLTPKKYGDIKAALKQKLAKITINEESIATVLSVLEAELTNIPAVITHDSASDISLYDHLKLTAALANCICLYGKTSDEQLAVVMGKKREFYNEKAFLIFSCDFSGIQKFIYNVVVEETLKSLRARSFFLEIFLEHIVDEILTKCGLPRTNLLYTGGGHAYLLLPNTEAVTGILDSFKKQINKWLQKNFGTSLFLSSAHYACSANDLMNYPAENSPYQNIYRQLSQQMSKQKIQRYSFEEIKSLNSHVAAAEMRECKTCGSIAALADNRCNWCNSFADLGGMIFRDDLSKIIIVTEKPKDKLWIKLPQLTGDCYLYLADDREASRLMQCKDNIRRIYRKNKHGQWLPGMIDIYLGDYVASSNFNELAQNAAGVERIAVMRADVDNLGTAFTGGFTPEYSNLARTACFSRQMSLFFKYHISKLLQGHHDTFSLLSGREIQPKQATIVYSGGDDIFLVGAWNEVIEAAVNLKNAFDQFTIGKLSFSAGIGIFEKTYPIYQSAYYTGELEDCAKQNEGKNSLCLFTSTESHTYKWDEFQEKVVGEKLTMLQGFFSDTDQERGTSFLYQLLEYLRLADEKINIARYAYLLARLEPRTKNHNTAATYNHFAKKMYQWILNKDDRRQLMTAIYIHTYLQRQRGNF